jgi:hypothetical protein
MIRIFHQLIAVMPEITKKQLRHALKYWKRLNGNKEAQKDLKISKNTQSSESKMAE